MLDCKSIAVNIEYAANVLNSYGSIKKSIKMEIYYMIGLANMCLEGSVYLIPNYYLCSYVNYELSFDIFDILSFCVC